MGRQASSSSCEEELWAFKLNQNQGTAPPRAVTALQGCQGALKQTKEIWGEALTPALAAAFSSCPPVTPLLLQSSTRSEPSSSGSTAQEREPHGERRHGAEPPRSPFLGWHRSAELCHQVKPCSFSGRGFWTAPWTTASAPCQPHVLLGEASASTLPIVVWERSSCKRSRGAAAKPCSWKRPLSAPLSPPKRRFSPQIPKLLHTPARQPPTSARPRGSSVPPPWGEPRVGPKTGGPRGKTSPPPRPAARRRERREENARGQATKVSTLTSGGVRALFMGS